MSAPRIHLPHIKSRLPGSSVEVVIAIAYGRRVGRRDSLLHVARWTKSATERAESIRHARNWHRMAMESLRELRKVQS